VEREEFINVGVILFCLERRFLGARLLVDEKRIVALWPDADVPIIQSHVSAFSRICEGDKTAGPIAALSQRERFHWLVAPRSTMIQISPVHAGLCDAPELALEKLFQHLVML
jgi:hypothetical protein